MTGVQTCALPISGADPGPACYNLGGNKPTITDANFVAGRIDPERFLKGKYKIDINKSYEAMQGIADYYKISVEEAARAIIRIANNDMINALKLISVRRGYDPNEFVMVAMGGNGGVFSPALGRELNVKKIIIPPNPGVFSAWGMLMTDLRQDLIRTKIIGLNKKNVDIINKVYNEILEESVDMYKKFGFEEKDLYIIKSADIRYAGQEHTVNTPISSGNILEKDLEDIRNEFERLHEQYYSFKLPEADIEFVNFNITAFCKVDKAEAKTIDLKGSPEEALRCRRVVDFDEDGKIEVPVYVRERLGTGNKIMGPAIIEEQTSVTVLYKGQKLHVDNYGNLIIEEA